MRELIITRPNQVGEVLRGRRRTRKLSQQRIADILGVSQGRFSKLEANPAQLTLERLFTLVNVLGLELVIREQPAARATEDW
ncbi:MAG: helix-turn-helix transcriptional regulator [Polyangiaceae bacterium]